MGESCQRSLSHSCESSGCRGLDVVLKSLSIPGAPALVFSDFKLRIVALSSCERTSFSTRGLLRGLSASRVCEGQVSHPLPCVGDTRRALTTHAAGRLHGEMVVVGRVRGSLIADWIV